MSKKKVKKSPGNIDLTKSKVSFWDKFEAKTSWQLLITILLPLLIYLKVINFEFVGFDDKIITRGR